MLPVWQLLWCGCLVPNVLVSFLLYINIYDTNLSVNLFGVRVKSEEAVNLRGRICLNETIRMRETSPSLKSPDVATTIRLLSRKLNRPRDMVTLRFLKHG